MPLLSIIPAVSKISLSTANSEPTLLLATRQTKSAKLYDPIYSKLVHTTEEHQRELDEIIQTVNAGGNVKHQQAHLGRIIDSYPCPNALLACTELSLLMPINSNKRIVDSLESLAEAAYLVSSNQRDLESFAGESNDTN